MKIRLAEYTDKRDILLFIKEYWNQEHIFIKWDELFDNYYGFSENRINFAIAQDEQDGKIYGICGFIYANHNLHPDVWLALWRVIPSSIPGLGMQLVNFIHKELKCRVLCCCGIREDVKKLYRFMGYTTGSLKHFYFLADHPTYNIAIVNRKKPSSIPCGLNKWILIASAEEFESRVDFDDEVYKNIKPYKDMAYIENKYYHNLAYQYKVWGICEEKSITEKYQAIIIGREICCNGSKILRIVDFLGNELLLENSGVFADTLLREQGYEYIDIYEYGLKDETLEKLGMVLWDEDDPNIIPNYFEPFEQSNVKIHFFTSDTENFRMFKADGDQERPNVRPGEEII